MPWEVITQVSAAITAAAGAGVALIGLGHQIARAARSIERAWQRGRRKRARR